MGMSDPANLSWIVTLRHKGSGKEFRRHVTGQGLLDAAQAAAALAEEEFARAVRIEILE